MNRRKFVGITGAAIAAVGTAAYWFSDKSNLVRADMPPAEGASPTLKPDEEQILFLASLAPSGHNTQPWFVHYLAPYHWIIGNDKTKWLPAVDPVQRETILSIGAFLQNLEYAAQASGYTCRWTLLAGTNQDERVMEVALSKDSASTPFDIAQIESRRTVRAGFLRDTLTDDDLNHLIGAEPELIHYLPATGKEGRFINEQTIEANRLQSYRDPAQQELADWLRFSSEDARKYRDGLTTGSMEIDGMAGWVVRNLYGKANVMKTNFRERGVEAVKNAVSESAGWILITSRDASVAALLETGRRMQRLFLKVRERHIAIHPMTLILEETSIRQMLQPAIGIGDSVQFILRTGYVAKYPPPVSLRRPVSWFVRLPTTSPV